MVREIITIQLGSLSNHIATHFWNTQEAYFTYGEDEQSAVDHDIHWRQGIGVDGSDTFLPRTLIYDFKRDFGSLATTNPLYESPEDRSPDHIWHNGPHTVQRLPAIHNSPCQQSLDTGGPPAALTTAKVRFWSDFSRLYFHPRSLNPLSEVVLGSGYTSFDDWNQGRGLFEDLDRNHNILDSHLRPFVEECDLLQGLQMIAALDNGWGGFSSSFLEQLRDEFPKHCIWLWAPENTTSGLSRREQELRLCNLARSFVQAHQQASAVIPLGISGASLGKGIELDRASPWHLSALYSTGMETAMLPARLRRVPGEPFSTLADLAAILSGGGKRTISSLSIAVGRSTLSDPDSELNSSSLQMGLSNLRGISTVPDSPKEIFSQILTQRGNDRRQHDIDAVYESIQDHGGKGARPQTIRYCSSLGFPVLSSYPDIFNTISTDKSNPVSVDTLLRNDSSVGTVAKLLRGHLASVLRADDREYMGHSLSEIQDEYRGGWSSDSDHDDSE